MPRYLLDHALIVRPPNHEKAGDPSVRPGELGRFRFNGYAVTIRQKSDGTLHAKRVVQDLGLRGCRSFWYWLKTTVGAEGGAKWELSERDSTEVLSQCWARYRQRSLATYVPQADPVAMPVAPGDGMAPSGSRALPVSAGIAGAAFGATPVLERVLDSLGFHGRASLAAVGIHAGDTFDTMLVQLHGIRSLKGIKAFATRHGLDPSTSRTTLSLDQQIQVLAQMIDLVPMLPFPHCHDAMHYLGRVALHLHDRSASPGPLLGFLSRCIARRRHDSFMRPFVNGLVTRPMVSAAGARLAVLSYEPWRNSFLPRLLPDKAAYMALIDNLTGQESQHDIDAVLTAILGKQTAPDDRLMLWHELRDQALALLDTKPALAARQLAALAKSLDAHAGLDADGRHPLTGEGIVMDAWYALREHLSVLPEKGQAVELACGLAVALQRLQPHSPERAKAVASLDAWGHKAKLTELQRFRLELALLPQRPVDERAARWNTSWDTVANPELIRYGVEAVSQLAAVPQYAGWQKVVDYCLDRTRARPSQRASLLLPLIAWFDQGQGAEEAAGAEPAQSRIAEAAFQVLRDGGAPTPLLRCQWIPHGDVMAALIAHLPWPQRAHALAQRLSNAAKPWTAPDILVVKAQIMELAGHAADKNAHEDMHRALAALLAAFTERCDAQGLQDAPFWNAVLDLAHGLLPMVSADKGWGGATAFAALAALVDSLMQIQAAGANAMHPAHAFRIRALWDAMWSVLHEMPPRERQPMLDVLADRMRATGPDQAPGRRHRWSEQAMQQMLRSLSPSLPDCGRIVSQLVWAAADMTGQCQGVPRFTDLHERIWADAIGLPDDAFRQVAGNMIEHWFAKPPEDAGERRRWQDVRNALQRRLERMPAGIPRATLLVSLRLKAQ